MEKVLGTGGTLEQLTEEARATIKAADLPATTAATRTSHQISLTADDLRRSIPALRESLGQLRELGKLLEEQPEAIVCGSRPPKGKSAMRHWWSCARCSVAVLAWLALCGCQLRRPDTVASRMIEPQLVENLRRRIAERPPFRSACSRRRRAHIGRRLLHQRPDGELIEDAVALVDRAGPLPGHGAAAGILGRWRRSAR